jgi:site-specific recombinase XerD
LHAYAEELNPRTLARRLIALKQWHTYQGFDDPTTHPLIAKTFIGIKRLQAKPVNKAPVLTLPDLHRIVMTMLADTSLTACRDNALLQLGFFAGLRRSELVAIEIQHLKCRPEGIDLLIPSSKTDPLHQGQLIGIPYGKTPLCPVTAIQQWLARADIQQGPLFRQIKHPHHLQANALNARSVNLIIKKRAHEAHLPQAAAYSGHSLRRGMATSASLAGATESAIMRQGRWKSRSSVFEYIDATDRFKDNIVNTLLKPGE